MLQSRWIAGAVLLGACLTAPAARAQNQAPPPPPRAPGAAPGGAVVPAPGGAAGTGTATTRGAAQPTQPVPLPGIKTVMVFPFENNTTTGGRALGEALADAVQSGMEASRIYGTVKYSGDRDRPESLLVQRALAEQSGVLTDAIKNVIDPVKGTVDQARAMQIAQRTGMEAILLGSIEEYTYDKAANKVTMVATAQILNAFTGEPLKTAGVTGTATGTPSMDESAVAQQAATDVASRVLNGLAVPPPPQNLQKGESKKKKKH
jgi:hypothetical protein